MNLNELSKLSMEKIHEILYFCEDIIKHNNHLIGLRIRGKHENTLKNIGRDRENKFYILKNFQWSEVKREELKFEEPYETLVDKSTEEIKHIIEILEFEKNKRIPKKKKHFHGFLLFE